MVIGEWRMGGNQETAESFFTKVNEGNEAELKNGSEILNRRGHRDRRAEKTEDMTTDDSDFADERQEFFHKS
jgi:hypothetical protein